MFFVEPFMTLDMQVMCAVPEIIAGSLQTPGPNFSHYNCYIPVLDSAPPGLAQVLHKIPPFEFTGIPSGPVIFGPSYLYHTAQPEQ